MDVVVDVITKLGVTAQALLVAHQQLTCATGHVHHNLQQHHHVNLL